MQTVQITKKFQQKLTKNYFSKNNVRVYFASDSRVAEQWKGAFMLNHLLYGCEYALLWCEYSTRKTIALLFV